mgnify:CR=1 FL=1
MAARFTGLRFAFWIQRFRALPRAERAFAGVPSPCILRRPLFGFRLAIDVSRTPTHRLLYLEGERFIGERFLLSRLVPPGGAVVDVGANVGYYLLLIEKLAGPTGSVVAIEPSAENLPELKRNVAENGFCNVELREVAVGAGAGTVGFRAGINGGIGDAASSVYQVPLLTLDEIIGARRVDFLKIDVEGYEGRVLAGSRELLRRGRPTVFMEIHPHMLGTYGDTARGVVERLRADYESVELYENIEARLSPFGKFAVRYLGRDPVRRIADVEAFLAALDERPPVCTFWAVARCG